MVYAENFIYGGGIPEIVLTGLLNSTMPFIRYRTGDIGEVAGEPGRQYLKGVQGRVHDVIELSGKKIPTHFIKDSLERVGGLDEFQIVQTASGGMTVNLVAANVEKWSALEAKVKVILGKDVPVVFVPMCALKRVGWRDKFRYLIKETK